MGKDLKGKKLPAGICQRKDGLYSARFTSKTGRRVEKFFKKPNEVKKWLGDAKYEDKHNNIGASSQRYSTLQADRKSWYRAYFNAYAKTYLCDEVH